MAGGHKGYFRLHGKAASSDTKASSGAAGDGGRAGDPVKRTEQYWVDLEAFATSPHGLGIPKDQFWALSFREYRAREVVWENARRRARFDWASIMAAIANTIPRERGVPASSPYDWLPGEERPKGQEQPDSRVPWRTQDVETQKLALRQMLSFAAAYNQAKSEKAS